jgi:hypothetical protein
MKSLESRIDVLVECAKKNGKGSEAKTIISENLGKFLERKLHELEILTRPFLESFRESDNGGAKNELAAAFKRNFPWMTEAEARVAAGDGYSPRKNGNYSWDDLKGL